jgi:hypothetical protein
MNNSNSSPSESFRNGKSDAMIISDDGAITYVEGEADYTVRPIPPERLARAIAERELIEKCLADQKRESADQ